jgi:hypothetical protein
MFLLVFGSMHELEDVINDIYGSQGTICCKYALLMKLVSYVTTIAFVLAECSNDMTLLHTIAIELPSDLEPLANCLVLVLCSASIRWLDDYTSS